MNAQIMQQAQMGGGPLQQNQHLAYFQGMYNEMMQKQGVSYHSDPH
jgi:hypothetical protein